MYVVSCSKKKLYKKQIYRTVYIRKYKINDTYAVSFHNNVKFNKIIHLTHMYKFIWIKSVKKLLVYVGLLRYRQ